MSQNATVNVDIKLGVNKFHVDEGHPHIIMAANHLRFPFLIIPLLQL